MAAIVHSDSFAIFMRRIGYSVGLERTLERLTDLERIYRSNRDLTLPSWKNLVTSECRWGLANSKNIADVYFSLRFIQEVKGDVLVLENLDSMAIACKYLEKESERETVRAFIFLWAILVNDGEIFMNLLLSNFDDAQIKKKLSTAIDKKLSVLHEIFPRKETMRRISRIVTIERQETNKGSAGIGQSVNTLIRTKPLQEKELFRSDHSVRKSVQLSDDYFRKHPPRRKYWALSLGLWDDKVGLTCKGCRLIDAMIQSGYISDDGVFTFWPMDYELIRAGFRPDLLPNTKNLWDTLIDFGKAFTDDLSVESSACPDTDHTVKLIQEMMKIFRSLHTRKSMLRREMAITIAYPAIIAISCAQGVSVADIPGILKKEQIGDKRRITLRRSRLTGGALGTR